MIGSMPGAEHGGAVTAKLPTVSENLDRANGALRAVFEQLSSIDCILSGLTPVDGEVPGPGTDPGIMCVTAVLADEINRVSTRLTVIISQMGGNR